MQGTAASIEDSLIHTPQGRLQVRRWRPAAGAGGAPIVLFHDSLGCIALWRDFPAQLAATAGREVIAYDRLGFGRSDPHPGRLDAGFIHDEAASALPALRQGLGIGNFIALGHSVGGAMATVCAATFPQACQALVTISAQAFVEDRTLQGIRAAEADFARPGQLERLARHHGDKARWVLHAWIDTWLSADFAGWCLDAPLRQLQCPLLCLHGEQDEFGSALQPQRIASLAGGGAAMHLLPDCGHVPQRQQPETVLALLNDFLGARD